MATLTPGGWRVWGRPLVCLTLLIFCPLFLMFTPLRVIGLTWLVLLILAAWVFAVGSFVGAVAGASMPALSMVERLIRTWVAGFSPEPELLWLQWARQSHYPNLGRLYLDRALRLGGREAQFQEGLVFLEGGMGTGGQTAGIERLRRAALRGHPEAAFRLAEALRTGQGHVLGDASEAEVWYQRAAFLGFGPAAAWLAHAYEVGDGVQPEEAKARQWSELSAALRPHPPLSHSLLRHDAAPTDPLVQVTHASVQGLEEAAARLIVHRAGRWGLFLGAALLAGGALIVVGAFFWAGSSGLHHLPLLMLMPPLLMLGWQAFRLRQDRPRAGRDKLLEAAEAGDPEACYRLGLAYRQGSHLRPRDDLSAALWFRRAAEAGHVEAMAALAAAYLGGHGLMRDPREAARWTEAMQRKSTSGPDHPMET